MRSIRSFNRDRTADSRRRSERSRGFALVAALAVAVLYFGLIELILIDSARELEEARRFRSRVVASALAENAAELAALGLTDPARRGRQVSLEDAQGTMTARMEKDEAGIFEIEAEAASSGLVSVRSTVRVYGRVQDTKITIDYTMHSQ